MNNTGLQLPKKIETKKEGALHVLGSSFLPSDIVNPQRDWTPYVKDLEHQQRDGEETNSCTVQATTNADQLFVNKDGGDEQNSKRYIANLAVLFNKLDPARGANPHNVMEFIRTYTGFIPEHKLPYDRPFYGVDSGLLQQLRQTDGQFWLNFNKFNHGWVWTDNPVVEKKRHLINEALAYGPVCVSGVAWHQNEKGLYYKPDFMTDGHFFVILADYDDHYVALDSYPPYIKKLDPNFDFTIAKVVYIRERYNFTKNLGFKGQDREIEKLQKALVKLGYPIPHAVTDFYGPETRIALWKYQMAKGIPDDGTHFGPRTRYALNKSLDTSYGGILEGVSTFIQSLTAQG